ncbi:putative manganese-dependent inorganic diphosphatase [Oscillatoria laete-virens NRMC-F 0139]|nr:putative manganese-dependent inorganic diphosphatase [Oscillatoria laete-virens]MDL5053069.1 putative manganese-dependent inorganic diphosphatase [Oscillatoria laete-virens NRMC-F 0139]
MNEILVIGHRNPDADAICSAIGYADFKQKIGMTNVIPARCGDTNARIDFILNYFQLPTPRFVADINPNVSDIMRDKVEFAESTCTAFEVLSQMDEKNLRALPIVDADRKVLGILSVFKLSHYYMPSQKRLKDSRRVRASLNNILKTLSAKPIHLVNAEQEEELILMIAAMEAETFSKRFKHYTPEQIAIIVGDRVDIQFAAIRQGVRLIVITGNLEIDQHIIDLAKQKNVSILVTPHDSATTSMLVRASVGIGDMMDQDFLSFPPSADLDESRAKAALTNQNAFPVTDNDGRIVGIFSKSDFLQPVEKQLILVDHNELSQAVRGAERATILEILDHHKIGAVTTNQPILFLNIPWGSTSTIVADQYLKHGIEIPAQIAGVLMSGLISDTLNLRSPTTTPRDAEILKHLAGRAGISADALAEKLFSSGSVLSIKTAAQAIVSDCKEYEDGGHKFSVAQVEELGFAKFLEKKGGLLEELDIYARKNNYLFACLLVTDINTNSSYLLVRGNEKFIATIDYEKTEPFVFDLPGVVSRKKQLLPYLLRCMANPVFKAEIHSPA